MKQIFTLLIVIVLAVTVHAQAPQKMSYQAVVRHNNGQLIVNQQIGMKISILQNSPAGNVVYMETQTPQTNANGLISIEIGGGSNFQAIDWSTGIYFIKTEIDPAGGVNYTIEGITQLLSVPYAFYAETSGNPIPGERGEQGIQGEQGDVGIAIALEPLFLDEQTIRIDLTAYMDLLNALGNRINALEEQVEESQNQIEELQNQMEDLQEQIEKLQTIEDDKDSLFIEFAPIGAEWYYTNTFGYFPDHFNHIISEKDTMVAGSNCRVLRRYYDGLSIASETYIIKQEQGKVYYYYQDQFHLLYDFDAKVNDTITFSFMGINTVFSARAIVENITTNAQNLKTFTTKVLEEDRLSVYFPSSYVYTEKIGVYSKFIQGIESIAYIPEHPPYNHIRCYSDADVSFVSDEWAAKYLPCNATVRVQTEFASIGTKWHYSYSTDSPIKNFNCIVSEKDTVVEGYSCRILSQYHDNSTVASKKYIIKQEKQGELYYGGKVYYYYQDRFNLLFDFDAKINDTVTFTFMYKEYSNDFPLGKDTLFSARFRVESTTTNYRGLKVFTTRILKEDVLHFGGISVPPFSEYSYTERIGFEDLLGTPLYREFIPMFDNMLYPEIEYFRGLRCFFGSGWDPGIEWVFGPSEWWNSSLPCNYTVPIDYPIEIPFTEYSLTGTSCQWLYNSPFGFDKITIINSDHELENYIEELGNYYACTDDNPEINFSEYSLICARGRASSSPADTEKQLLQISENEYSLELIIRPGPSPTFVPWFISIIVPKLSQNAVITLNINRP